MKKQLTIPTALACACCGKPVDCLNSYGVTPPIPAPVEPSDFCSLGCLALWAGAKATMRHYIIGAGGTGHA